MPTYDYVCGKCDHKFELFQTITAGHKRKCPECGALKLRRLIGSGAAIVFKGSGFYQTDYRSDSYKKQAAADKKPTSDGKSKSSGDSSTSTSTEKSSSDSSGGAKSKQKD